MFNEELKRQFIDERNKEVVLPQNYLKCQFNKVSEMEKDLNKDVSNFTVYEIIEYYKLLNTSSLESLVTLNSQFSIYTQWCLQNNLVSDNQNHFLEITIEMVKGCISKVLLEMKIISKDKILDWVDQLPNPKDQFILLGLFEGIKGKDFCELSKLRPADINGNIATLCTGRKIELSKKLLEIIDACLSTDLYYSISGKGDKIMPLVNNGYIIKDYPNAKDNVSDFQMGRKIYNAITRILDYFGMLEFMSANSIFESGKLNMIKERANELNITSKEYLYSDHIKEIESKYNLKMIRSTFWAKYEDYLT